MNAPATHADSLLTTGTPPDVFHIQRDDAYDRALQEEAAFWDKPQPFGVDLTTPETAAYHNERHTGDATTAWQETIARYGDFRRGLMLGTSGLKLEATILRTNPNLHLTFCDVSTASLAERASDLGRQFPGRVETREIDLNFANFPADSYDLIVSSSSIHHITNLEHIAYQSNRALTADGYFFLQDYVAESRFAFSDEKKRIFESALAAMQARHPEAAGWHIEWPDQQAQSPFEAVRSGEILGVLRGYLREERLRLSGALLTMLILLRYDGTATDPFATEKRGIWRRIIDASRPPPTFVAGDRGDLIRAVAPDLIPLDAVLCDAGMILPSNAFAIYRKRI